MSSIPQANRSRIAQRREEKRRKTQLIYIAAAAGVLLLAAAAHLVLGRGSGSVGSAASFEYSPEDVALGAPILAVHEMGQGPPIPFLPASDPQPVIGLNETFVNVGSIGPTEVVTREFAIANLGEGPLTISRAYTTCGCTTAEISSAEIAPGQVAEVTMIFDAGFHDTRGQTVRRGLIVESNDPRQPIQEIWLQAAVRNN